MKKNFRVKAMVIALAFMLVFTVMPMFGKADAQVININSLLNCTNTQTLKLKDCNARVAALEKALCKLGYLNKSCVNNYFDNATKNAVAKFQAKNCLPVTGKADAKTCALAQAKAAKCTSTKQTATPAPVKKTTQVPTPTAKPSTTTAAPAAVKGLTADEQQMLNLVNQERAKVGAKPLVADLQLTRLARLKCQDMINKGYFAHQSPTYGSPFDMLRNAGISFRTAGENLAGNPSVQGAHTSLMNSPGHRANILNTSYTKVGIGIVNGGPYGKMFSQLFIG